MSSGDRYSGSARATICDPVLDLQPMSLYCYKNYIFQGIIWWVLNYENLEIVQIENWMLIFSKTIHQLRIIFFRRDD